MSKLCTEVVAWEPKSWIDSVKPCLRSLLPIRVIILYFGLHSPSIQYYLVVSRDLFWPKNSRRGLAQNARFLILFHDQHLKATLNNVCKVNGFPIFRSNFYRFNLKSTWLRKLSTELIYLNILNVVEENFLNTANIGQLNHETLMFSGEATVNRNWIARVFRSD